VLAASASERGDGKSYTNRLTTCVAQPFYTDSGVQVPLACIQCSWWISFVIHYAVWGYDLSKKS